VSFSGVGWIGRPKPVAKEAGFARPARPKIVISAVPIRIARHSAGGGRFAKRLRVVVDILGGGGVVLKIAIGFADGVDWGLMIAQGS